MLVKEDFLRRPLHERQQENKQRFLSQGKGLVDLTSNDYLGFARSSELCQWAQAEYGRHSYCLRQTPPNGSTGSRLLTGNHAFVEELEHKIADFHGAMVGLIYNNGYVANLGLLSAVAGAEDVVLLDREAHASMWDGARLSGARVLPFRHNDMEHLDSLLAKEKGKRCFVSVEALYSISGDLAPLEECVRICEAHQAYLIVDEAHSSGIMGPQGRGAVCAAQLEDRIFARVHTFGKGLGAHGAIILGSPTLREYLINFSRPFIYSTALPLFTLVLIDCAYQMLEEADQERERLTDLISHYNQKIPVKKESPLITPIQCLAVEGGNAHLRSMSQKLATEGFHIYPILHPTVRKGQESLRICLHSFNTTKEIDHLIQALERVGAFKSLQTCGGTI